MILANYGGGGSTRVSSINQQSTRRSLRTHGALMKIFSRLDMSLRCATEGPAAAKDEVFGVTSVISLPDSQKLGSFDISFVDPANEVYLLADRTNKSIDVVDTSTNTLTHQLTAPAPGFAGAVLCPPPSNAANDCAGPDGVLVANGHQIWVGDEWREPFQARTGFSSSSHARARYRRTARPPRAPRKWLDSRHADHPLRHRLDAPAL